jgi:Na+/H+ antiporter NhaD/arsenite permease-like protein
VAELLASASDSLAVTALVVMWGSGFASGIVDNIPFTTTMVPVMKAAPTACHYGALQRSPRVTDVV